MNLLELLTLAFVSCRVIEAKPVAIDVNSNVKYLGAERNGIEVFLNIQYGQDTSGVNRFKPPRPFIPKPGTTYDATKYGPACPQTFGQWLPPLTLGNITSTSEDCLNLNVARPKGCHASSRLPVMIWIHGGSFWTGANNEPTTMPDGLVIESIKNGLPVIHVAMNYRLGFFGFAQSDALRDEKSENAGLRDQRLAIEWVRDNIAPFGGDRNRITIFGQSSGGLAVGAQLLAYGGTKPLPFQQGICESQALEPGITGSFTIDAMMRLVDSVGCNKTSVHSPETIACLRSFDTEKLFNASATTYFADIGHNIGDIWLPTVDDDFLPAPPSQLAKEGRFGDATYMIGWAQGDVNFFTDFTIATANDTYNFVQGYLPKMPSEHVNHLLSLYPVSEFTPPSTTTLTAEFYRSARIFRDIIMTCQPIYLAENINAKGNSVYLYDFNQTILEPIIDKLFNVSDIGVVHTSEFAYIYGNLSHYNDSRYPFNPKPSDYALVSRASRTWSTFASLGRPSLPGKDTVQGFEEAFSVENNTAIYVIGGPNEGLSTFDGPGSHREVERQRLRERCSYINSPEVIGYLQY
ncbi:putative lipase [Lindgomyces ingoldianus]|uniref:Lipase n=1 Tax=Lindgomyces ingoldianus TaxID=673940 RepID=A0ACB6RFY6_9PLEO|nr:putative lipase [Lindgomyces ingoldianus]KAF2477640.1 putative lipase [Lindgomyces ingoldianus]